MSLLFTTIGLVLGTAILLLIASKQPRSKFKPTISIVSLAWLILLVFGSFTKVSANEVGIIYDDRYGVLEEVKYEGFQTKSIFEHITQISTTNKTAFISVYGQTQDSIYAEFQITLVYRIEAANAGRFFRVTGGTDISKEQLDSIVKETLQANAIKYDIYGILGESLEELRDDFATSLTNTLRNRYHITLVSASFDDIDAGSEIEEIIKNKAKAIQEIQIAEQERQRAIVEAETAEIRAEAEASVAIIRAQGNAEAQIILNSVTVNAITNMYAGQFTEGEDLATPEVYGYLSIQEIAEVIVKQLYYDTWDGTLPSVITDGSGIIIQP